MNGLSVSVVALKTKVWSEKLLIKTIHIAFFDSNGLIHKEFLPESTTLNAVVYAEVLKRLMQRIRRVCPEYAKQDSWTLLHDNARPHTALVVRQFWLQMEL
ncbi:mariner Mos1 transposase [Trichonephila clavipes]|nr:mariner Mos1 transposase [Trichonephila clavipes]